MGRGFTAAITNKITTTTQRECILLVELLHAEYAHAHSTNRMHSICVVIVIVFDSKLVEMLRPIKKSLCGSEGNNDLLKAKVVVPASFLPSAQVVVKKQDSSFQN